MINASALERERDATASVESLRTSTNAFDKLLEERRKQELQRHPRGLVQETILLREQANQMIRNEEERLLRLLQPQRNEQLDSEKAQQRRSAFNVVIREWQAEGYPPGITAFYGQMLSAYAIEDRGQRSIVINAIHQQVLVALQRSAPEVEFTAQDVEELGSRVWTSREAYGKYLLTRQYFSLADFGDGQQFRNVREIITNNTLLPAEKQRRIREIFQGAADAGHGSIGMLLVTAERTQKSVSAAESREQREMQQQILREQVTNQLALQHARLNLDQLSPADVQILGALVNQGGGDLAFAMLTSSALRRTPQGLVGTIGGADVTVDLRNGRLQCSLTQNGTTIPIQGGLNALGFNNARLTNIGTQTASEFLVESSLLRERIWTELTGEQLSSFMSAQQADVTASMFRSILLNRGSRDQEVAALRQLHLITENGEPERQFLSWWAVELRSLLSELHGQRFDQIVQFSDLQNIAEQWHRERRFSVVPLSSIVNNRLSMRPRERGPDVARES